MVLVGEQPGDREDPLPRPSSDRPAAWLNRVLGKAGVARADAYLTNAVKHLRFERPRQGHPRPAQRAGQGRVVAGSGRHSTRVAIRTGALGGDRLSEGHDWPRMCRRAAAHRSSSSNRRCSASSRCAAGANRPSSKSVNRESGTLLRTWAM